MKTGIRNGIIMMALYFLMLFIISLLPTGDVNRIIKYYENLDSLGWQVEISTYLGLFIVGFIHGWTRTPNSLLLIGFGLIPLIVWLLILPVLAITNSPRYVLALTYPGCTLGLAFIPTLIYWAIKKYSRPKIGKTQTSTK